MKERLTLSLEQTFQAPIRAVAVSVRPLTIGKYHRAVNSLLRYLQAAHPRVHRLSQLHRDPHILGWLRWMCEKEHPLANITRLGYILCLRRLLAALEVDGSILRGDLPRRDQYLPRPLSPKAMLSWTEGFGAMTTSCPTLCCSSGPPVSVLGNV